MKTINKVELIGYLGQNPIITTTAKGVKKATLRVATHYYVKEAGDEKTLHTVWHDVVVWEKTAEQVENQYIKGSHIRIEGRLQYRTYEDRTGHVRYVTEVIAKTLMNLDR